MGEIYNEEFQQYMNLARRLAKNLRDGRDLGIYRKWIKKLCSLESEDMTVKKNRNAFFKYMLHVLQDGRLEGPFTELQLQTEEPAPDNLKCPCAEKLEPKKEEEPKHESPPVMCYWSPDTSTYVGIQPLRGCGALIYMAISYNTDLGWEIP